MNRTKNNIIDNDSADYDIMNHDNDDIDNKSSAITIDSIDIVDATLEPWTTSTADNVRRVENLNRPPELLCRQPKLFKVLFRVDVFRFWDGQTISGCAADADTGCLVGQVKLPINGVPCIWESGASQRIF